MDRWTIGYFCLDQSGCSNYVSRPSVPNSTPPPITTTHTRHGREGKTVRKSLQTFQPLGSDTREDIEEKCHQIYHRDTVIEIHSIFEVIILIKS